MWEYNQVKRDNHLDIIINGLKCKKLKELK